MCRLPSTPQVVLRGDERRSLAYKLAARPEAIIDLRQALQAAGQDLHAAADRCAVQGAGSCH